MFGWIKHPVLPLLAAAALFSGLSLAQRGPGEAWVVVRPVAAGARVTPGDVRFEPISRPFSPGDSAYARIPLTPGMLLGAGDVSGSSSQTGDELSVAVSNAASAEIAPGDRVRLGESAGGHVWLSPLVTVVAVSGGGLGGLSGSLTVTGPAASVLAVLRHDGDATGSWLVMKVGGGQ